METGDLWNLGAASTGRRVPADSWRKCLLQKSITAEKVRALMKVLEEITQLLSHYKRSPSLWKDQGKDYVAQYKARENKRRTSGLAAMDSNTLETDWHVFSPYDIIIIAIINSVIIITVIVIIIVSVIIVIIISIINIIIITRTNHNYYCFFVSLNTCL